MPKVLVTGGTGFIGSHTVVELLQKNYEVVIVDDLSNSSAEVLVSIAKIAGVEPEFEQLDLCDKNKLKDFLSRHKDIQAVIHFAAKKAVGESVENPLMYYKNNIVSFVNLLECMLENAIKFIVFSSSCTVYGEPDYLPVDEHAPIKKATSPYGNTKQICEEILEDTIAANNEKLEGIALRYFNPAGAHDSALIGELPMGIPNNLIPFVTQTAIGKRDKLKVFGGDYETPDGSCIRDFIHVVDLAKAHIIALERMINLKIQSPYEVFNLGTGVGYSVLDVVKTFEKISGVKLNYEVVGRRDGDIMQIYADTSLANHELGWSAERGLEQMLDTAWKWELALKNK
jgi:UDP-glucose 4-epimerase